MRRVEPDRTRPAIAIVLSYAALCEEGLVTLSWTYAVITCTTANQFTNKNFEKFHSRRRNFLKFPKFKLQLWHCLEKLLQQKSAIAF